MNIPDTIRERFGIDIREVAGATVAGEIPVSDALVNRLIAERLRHPQIAAIRVQAQENGVVNVLVVPAARMMPSLKLTARIERQPELPQNPTLLLHWSMPAAGPLAMFAAPVLSYFKALPPGIRMDGDRIAVDLRELLRARGLDDALMFLRALTIHTRSGGFVVRFDLAVPT